MELDRKRINTFFNINQSEQESEDINIKCEKEKLIEENKIVEVAIKNLVPFKNQPFKVYSEEKKQEMIRSIKEYGVLTPIIIRPMENSIYEIISGHNRVICSKEAGFITVPSMIKQLDDDDAICLMIDTNFNQRENLLPSEKAFAYKMRFEALKRKGKIEDFKNLNTEINDRKLENIGKSENISERSVQRYIKLTDLIPNFLELLDTKKLKFNIAMELSFLRKNEQEILYAITSEKGINISESQVEELKKKSKISILDENKINEILSRIKKVSKSKSKITLNLKKFAGYIAGERTTEEIEQIFIEALEFYYTNKSSDI